MYSFRFRAGLRYSNGTRLKASDFRRAVDRARRVRSPYAALFAAIDEIQANDHSGRVIVTLTRPDSTFEYALALPASAPVPRGTPSEELGPAAALDWPLPVSEPPAGGAMGAPSARAFDLPDLPVGNVDEVTIERFGTPAAQADAVAIGTTLDLMQEPPPTSQLPEIRSKYDDRYEEQATASALSFFIDPAYVAVRRPQGSPGGEPCNRRADARAPVCRPPRAELQPLPPSVPGYRRIEPCPYGERRRATRTWRGRAIWSRTPARTGTAVAVEPSTPRCARRRVALLRLDASEDRARGAGPADAPAARR